MVSLEILLADPMKPCIPHNKEAITGVLMYLREQDGFVVGVAEVSNAKTHLCSCNFFSNWLHYKTIRVKKSFTLSKFLAAVFYEGS